MAEYWGTKVGGYQIKMVVTHSQNIENNTTTFWQDNYLVLDPGWSISDYAATVYASVRGTNTYSWGPGYKSFVAGTTWISGASRTVTHNSDGTLSGSTIAASIHFPATGYNLSASTTYSVATIPRATTPTLAAGTSLTTGAATTIQLLRASTGFTHDVTYKIGSKTGSIATGAGVSASFTPAHDLATEFPSAASHGIEITVVTKQGTTVIGTKKATFTLTAGAAVVPTVTEVLWDDLNPDTKTTVGAFVQGESLITGAVTAEGVYGSTIEEKTLTAAGQSFGEGAAYQPSTSGTIVAKGAVRDSRNRTAEKAANFTVLAYSAPTLSQLTLVRRAVDAEGTAGDGQFLRLDITAAVASLKPASAEKNQLRLRVRTRPLGGAWTERNDVVHTSLSYDTQMIMVTGGDVFAAVTTYEVEITITDVLGKAATLLRQVGTTGATLDLADTGTGHGKIWERGAIDAGPGGIYDDGKRVGGYILGSGPVSDLPSAYPTGQSSLSADGSWPNTWGNVLTVKATNSRAVQLNFHQSDPDISVRRAVITAGSDAWGDWVPLAGNVVGQVTQFAGDTAPSGWLLCQGQAVSRTTYAELYGVLGNKYGAGDGSTTFNVPDLRGRVAAGLSSDTEFNTLGKVFGSKTHTLTTAQMPSHTHSQNSHSHRTSVGWGAGSTGGGYGRTDSNSPGTFYSNVGATTATNNNTGGGGAHNNIQPTITLNYIIRT